MAPRTERSGPPRGVGPDPHKATGASGTTVDLTVPAPGDLSDELGSLAALMTQPGTLAEPREVSDG